MKGLDSERFGWKVKGWGDGGSKTVWEFVGFGNWGVANWDEGTKNQVGLLIFALRNSLRNFAGVVKFGNPYEISYDFSF